MFPLDFYGRHHQALANSFLSSYSNANNPNLMVQQYLQQCTPQQMLNNYNTLKESNSNNHPHFTNMKSVENVPSNPTNNNSHQNLAPKFNHIENTIDLTYENSDKFQRTYHNGCESKTMLNLCNSPKVTNPVLQNPIPYSNGEPPHDAFVNKNENIPQNESCNRREPSKVKVEGPSDKTNQYPITTGSSQSNLPHDNHNVNSENEVKARYSCDTCSYACQSPAILKIHERVHSGEKPFACSYCDYKSGQKNNIAKHVLVHMKKKPYRCQYCDYRCAQKNNLIVHERTHTGVKPFACTFCEYKTVQKPNLVKHMYLHTNEKPFACDMCDYRCVQKTNLTKHKQKHTLEKPFECTDCDYRSSQKSNLNKHQLIHAKNKTVQCEQCPYKCLHVEDLEKHRQSKHGVTKREATEEAVPGMLHNGVNLYNSHPDNSQYSMINASSIKCETNGVNF